MVATAPIGLFVGGRSILLPGRYDDHSFAFVLRLGGAVATTDGLRFRVAFEPGFVVRYVGDTRQGLGRLQGAFEWLWSPIRGFAFGAFVRTGVSSGLTYGWPYPFGRFESGVAFEWG